jgi:hypothetical protein
MPFLIMSWETLDATRIKWNTLACSALHCKEEEFHMHPAFWPMQALVFWLDVLMLPWKMTMAPVANSMDKAAAATNPAAVVGLDPGKSHGNRY